MKKSDNSSVFSDSILRFDTDGTYELIEPAMCALIGAGNLVAVNEYCDQRANQPCVFLDVECQLGGTNSTCVGANAICSGHIQASLPSNS